MDHHSNQPDMERLRKLLADEAQRLGLGATGQFPEGKLSDHDEGEIKVAIATTQGKIVINFGKSINFLAMTPEQGLDFAQIVSERALALLTAKKGR